MQFIAADLFDNYISKSYDNILQQYISGSYLYIVDSHGNVVSFILTSSIGSEILTSDLTGSLSFISASYALSSSYSDQSYNSLTASSINFSIVSSSYSDNSSTASYVQQAITSSYAQSAGYSISASYLSGSTAYLEISNFSSSVRDALFLVNTASASASLQQNSPAIRFVGQGWSTTNTASRPVEWRMYTQPV